MNLNESIPPHVRRRLNFELLKDDVDSVIDYVITPAWYENSYEFASEVCDTMVMNYVDTFHNLTPKDKDELYHYFFDMFSEYLVNYYNEWKNKDKNLDEELKKMKSFIFENENKRFTKNSDQLQNVIYQYLNKRFSTGNRQIRTKKRNYGNLGELWCVDGNETLIVNYYFEDGKFDQGIILVAKELVSDIQKLFSVREAYTMYIIEEWYDDVMVPEFQKIVGENNLDIDKISTMSKTNKCIPEPVKPEGITDDEMIEFITKNTLHKKDDVIKTIQSGKRDLDDFYLDIVDTVNRRKEHGW